jgi:hypothetical protein
MRQRLETGQAEKPARAFDRVDEAENVVEDLRVIGFLLEPNQLDVDDVEALVRFGEKLAQQIVHRLDLDVQLRANREKACAGAFSPHTLSANPLRLVA